jgi:alpha-L-rhamnosidase/Glycosyl hydrolases family 2, sugar binding domain/F5/8 type C domain
MAALRLYQIGLALFLAAGLAAAPAQDSQDSLRRGFEQPPESARPRVWWHWMNGNITEDGIKLDLEWMHRVGLAGFHNFDAALATPQVVPKRLAYMTPGWQNAFRYATSMADKFGMEEAIGGSPGWSESGGPWVPASQGMKKYVWSETAVEGGRSFTGALAHPPSSTGAFQNIGSRASRAASSGGKIPQFYADAVVIAFRKPASDVDIASLHPRITASGGSPDFALLSDGDLETTTGLPIPPPGQKAWIQYAFSEPTTIRSVTIVAKDSDRTVAMTTGIAPPEKALEASDDGQTWREVAKLSAGGSPELTVSFAPVTAKFFRVTFLRVSPPPPPAWAVWFDPSSFGSRIGPPPTSYEIAELVIHPGARVNHFEEKAAFTPEPDLYGFATPQVAPEDAIRKADVVDLTSKMKPDGTLDWTPPPSSWTILRFGYSLLGTTNHPATPEATGLEVDKLDHRSVHDYMEKYLDSYKQTVGSQFIGGRGIRYIVNDSWEAGSQNWTDTMIEQFRKRRGYDPLPWMPVLAGRVVESAEASDAFLWDFRKTIADLIADEHYGELETVIHEWGMKHYGESHEGGRAFVADGMEVKKFNEIPMSAMWTQTPGVYKEQYGYDADDRESASVAHIYGQNLAAAESLTAATYPWAWSPATLRPTADQEFLNGINRIVIHESTHQPLLDKKPGLTLGRWGQWFNRNETWAEQAGPWVDYLARISYLLQQGRFAADLIYFYGEDSNLTAIFANKAPDVPLGYGFDYVNADALIHELHASGGSITTASGMRYRLLGLDPYSQHMSLPVLRAIRDLVAQGASVAGPMPEDDPSLADNQEEFRRLRQQLFGDGNGVHHVGKGTVYAGQTPAEALRAMQVAPDFDYSRRDPETHLEFVHRRMADGDAYFVDNRSGRDATVETMFRVTGKAPELWYAESGQVEPASYHIEGERTTVPLHLEPWGSVFVVFRKPAIAASREVPALTETTLTVLNGSWNVEFPPNWGAPSSITLDSLSSWSDSPDPGVKYFSGTGTYTKTVHVPEPWLAKGTQLWIDLGDVKNLAEVEVNGKPLGIVWHAPYRVDATEALKSGANQLTIRVTNAWVNRLIGDQQPDATKYTFADVKPYHANSPLLPSGLLGPVRIISRTSK